MSTLLSICAVLFGILIALLIGFTLAYLPNSGTLHHRSQASPRLQVPIEGTVGALVCTSSRRCRLNPDSSAWSERGLSSRPHPLV